MEYHKTKDLIHVMQMLGHKSLRYSLVYTQFVDIPDGGYTCKTAKTIQEATQIIKGGFEYVTEMEGVKRAKLDAQFKSEVDNIEAKHNPLSETLDMVLIAPTKTNVLVRIVALVWTTH
jgi:hypothetical protein